MTNAIPLIIISHRKAKFLPEVLAALGAQTPTAAIDSITVVDDSGDAQWQRKVGSLGEIRGFVQSISVKPVSETNAGYLAAMETVWQLARESEADHVMLWEEDFIPAQGRIIDPSNLVAIIDATPNLAGLNWQRQPVWGIEQRLGYLESHDARGYELAEHEGVRIGVNRTSGGWVSRKRPFATSPCVLRREVFEMPWPKRDQFLNGYENFYEPQMSARLEAVGWTFGWYGKRDNGPDVVHVGDELKTGTDY